MDGRISTNGFGFPGLLLALGFCSFSLAITSRAQEITTENVVSSRMVIDFESTGDITVQSGPLGGRVVAVEGGHALEVKCDARGGYPSTRLDPTSGKWDFGPYDAVLMDIQNLDDAPVRVLLSLNNPGANGRDHCNTESVTIPARDRGILRVPYGMWHGSSGHPIDRSNITAILVLLDQPTRPHHFRVDNIRAVTYGRLNMADLLESPFYKRMEPFFGRGINLGNALDAPREGDWGVTLEDHYFPTIKAAGFDTVRIPVRWSAHADEAPPYRIDPAFYERVDWAVKRALDQGLNVVLNMHHYEEFFEDVPRHSLRFIALWDQIANHYRTYPPTVYFELLNEPHGQLAAAEWNQAAAQALKTVRASNPDRWVMIGPADYNSISRLAELDLPEDDRRIVVTVHYYSPHTFTHQGASWAGEQVKALKNVRWQGTAAERESVRKDLDMTLVWAIRHQRPVFLGEFGAYSPAPMKDRARWTRCIAREAAARKLGSAYWEFCAGFGAYDPQSKTWRKPLLKALIW